MKTFNSRNEMDDRYKWDVESVYSSEESFASDVLFVTEQLEKIQNFKGHILESSTTLFELIKTEEVLDRKLSNLYLYSKMKLDENTKDPKYQEMTAKVQGLTVKVSEASAYILPELLKADESLILKYIDENQELGIYRKYFNDILRRKKHTLSEREEELLAMGGEMAATPQKIFSMLSNADLKFPSVIGEDEKEIKITNGSFVPLMESKDRAFRKEVFEKFYSVFKDHKNAIAAMLDGEVKKNVFYAKAKKYSDSLEASLFKNNIAPSVYTALIDSVNGNLKHLHKYMALRKKVMALDDMHFYDIYPSLVKDVDLKFSFDEAKDIVIQALKPLGEAYGDVLEKAFDERWIDVYENEGKRSGAYSWGTYDTKPFILLNHHDTLDNMFTLAHELGHSMHSYLTRSTQPYVYGHYSIFLAEVASTTNEALLTDHLLKIEKDPHNRRYILNHYLDQFRQTLFRQVMFAEFELLIHQKIESGEALTAEILCELYGALNAKYYGEAMVIDEEIMYEWARIPHFYYNFYVFQYATGFSAAISLAKGILDGKENAVDKYLAFLSSGDSKYPVETLTMAGADMTKPSTVDSALTLFGELVDEFEKLMEQVD